MNEHTPVARLSRRPTRLLSLAAMYADRRVNERLATAEARKWHYALLATLEQFGPASQSDLSQRTGIYRSDLVSVINELAERGQVERAPNPADRRQNVITLTEEGHRQLLTLDALLAMAEQDVFAALTPAERDQLIALLTKLVQHP
ncbi:MarR family transcriptional regulator [Dactylosporangium sp. AC04546]|uniref:MarR family winged helix-turn-helix transcriptional regulator n=1 Tax=Dactylosporangium sp. AC04546 TaxID=2862460 RepID=UPI001EDF0462|nr:MarR family transcriptional regulator [Dactylosporangium sp. AC04546]WVK84294.1 MarR family transcriptional regulator [Dactylosporangium sp. AC04546]